MLAVGAMTVFTLQPLGLPEDSRSVWDSLAGFGLFGIILVLGCWILRLSGRQGKREHDADNARTDSGDNSS